MSIHLSPRERQIVRLFSLGCTTQEVARILRLAKGTVESHKFHAMARLGVHKAAMLTRMAIEEGISPLKDKLTAREKRQCGRKDDGWNGPMTARRPAGPETHRPVHLTPREFEVVRLASLGCTIKEVAAALKIPAMNALYHKTRAMRKFAVDSVVLLTRLAIQEGISSLDDRLTALEKRRSGRKDHGGRQPAAAMRPTGGKTDRRLDARYGVGQCCGKRGHTDDDQPAEENVACGPFALSPRERQIVRLLSLGCTNKEAARVLQIATCTADKRKVRAMARLGVNRVALLTRVAIKVGISPLDDKLTAREKRYSGRKNDGWN